MSTYEISQSSLLSLKAEILRKQEELSKAKVVNEVKLVNIKRKSCFKNKNTSEVTKTLNESSPEGEKLLQKSRAMLEAKAKLYDKLLKDASNSDDVSEDNRKYLVRFDKKASEVTKNTNNTEGTIKSDEEVDAINHHDFPNNSDEEWVEYVDCLGRTRTCMKKDLMYLKQDDEQLNRDVNARNSQNTPENNVDNSAEGNERDTKIDAEKPTEDAELLSADMRRELLRQQWENQEEMLKQKENIYYQDILFNEARVHGVAYYGFSKDEEERAKQQEALQKLRADTKEQQKKTQELKALRDKQMAARLKAARNRRRARMGLPPEEDVFSEPEAVEPQDQHPVAEAQPEQDEQELAREEARKKHVRPWDIGKEGVKEFYEYTQEEWVEKKRSDRPEEFAPPSSYRTEFHSVKRDTDELYEPEDKSLRFTTKRNKHKTSKYSINPYKNSNFEEVQQVEKTEPTPIVNECEVFNQGQVYTFENEDGVIGVSNGDHIRGQGVEIAPPSTFDYYGPNNPKRKKASSSKISLEESINAGLQFLRREYEKKQKSSKHPDEMFLM